MIKQYKLTQEKLDEFKEELEYLKTVREKEVAEQIKEARSFGDLSENSEYDEAKNEQGKLYSRIAELENIIPNAVIIDETDGESDARITIGATVTFVSPMGEQTMTIVGSQEANPVENRISDESPIGKALIGKSVNEEVTVEAPAGSFSCKIIKIVR